MHIHRFGGYIDNLQARSGQKICDHRCDGELIRPLFWRTIGKIGEDAGREATQSVLADANAVAVAGTYRNSGP